ncbi:LOW QUALITY PROTEIN: multimerin-2 [Danio aesculapii]|uniref:LOW QUALITY PROTEIN: multimerin-2 n=1 Tax=Danio aesculapii TaxID=1142201 RepID=UPI0024BFE9C4|nr:LOW QUALITY PROTEIN: multimerin-2 [Danio aesculapii]
MAQTLPLLLLAVLNSLSCHSEVRARDPDVEEEEAVGNRGRPTGTIEMAHLMEQSHQGIPMPSAGTVQDSADLRETVLSPARRGNWCAYVNHRVVTRAVLCATETQTVKSLNPCPGGAPDCQVLMYKQSLRPAYKQKHTTLSSIHWNCCPGYSGHNCLEKDKPSEDEKRASKSEVNDNDKSGGGTFSGGKTETDLMEDENWADKPLQETPIHDSSPNKRPDGDREGISTSQPLPIFDSSVLLTMHQLMSTMMSQIQPVLESFNQTLEHLSSEVNTLSQDLQLLRMEQEDNRLVSKGEGNSGPFQDRLEYNHLQISQIKTQLEAQNDQMERAFQTQQELLKHNLTKIKEKLDDQISQSQESQVNLQSLTDLVVEVRADQKKLEGALQRERDKFVNLMEGQPTRASGAWEAITRIDEKAQSNSVQLSSLSEALKDSSRVVQDLKRDQIQLEKSLEEVEQRTEVHFAETGLELEATHIRVVNSLGELTANVSAHEGQLREIELDLVNIYNLLQRNDSVTAEQACSCKIITSSLDRLEQEVDNVTQLARQNSLALEEADLERNEATEMEDLQHGLLNMKESLAFEQGRSRSLQDSILQLQDSLLDSKLEIQGLREQDGEQSAELQGLSAAFSSLLNDAVRHSEVLEVLLGEEVLEFTHWSQSRQKELSLPDLLQTIQMMQQKIETHDRSLTSLRRKHPDGDEMNSDDPVPYSERTGMKQQVKGTEGYQTSSADPSNAEDDVDYSVSDFWSLGKEVEQLANRISMLEERCGNRTEPPGGSVLELQEEIASLRQSLEDHLRLFGKLFSNTEELASSTRSLNLDEVWRMVRRKDGKRRRGDQKPADQMRNEERNSSGRGKRYSQREQAWLPQSPVVFITNLDDIKKPNAELTSKSTLLNYGGTFNPTSGVFQAPETGLYLFLVTIDFERGLSLAVLKRSGVPMASFKQEQGEKKGPVSRASLLELRRGEMVTLELTHGSLRKAQPGDNTLSGLLLFITEHKDML